MPVYDEDDQEQSLKEMLLSMKAEFKKVGLKASSFDTQLKNTQGQMERIYGICTYVQPNRCDGDATREF